MSGSGALWGGRFSASPAPEAHALGSSIAFDRRLAPQDVAASAAHALALRDAGLLSADDADRLIAAIGEVGAEIAAGRFVFDPADEDVHSAIERGVTDRLGDLGARLHAGRSRNDLAITDLRLWMRDAGERVNAACADLARAVVDRAREHAETVMPGMTHLRAAQPVTLGHHLCAHAWALARDRQRLWQWAARSSVSPLGAGALATSTLGLDAAATAERLGFAAAFANSLDAVSDRDVVQEFLAVAAIMGTHASRLAADLARWTDPALGWAELDEAFATGSSMMPHKRNPDTLELARAKAARIAGDLAALTAVLQGLPLGYARDLQEDKEPVFDAADTLELVLPALAGAVRTLRFDEERMRAACRDDGLYATDLAEELVRTGVPFREAHRRTGELVRRLGEEGRALGDLTDPEWEAYGLAGGAGLLDPDRSVRARGGPGGPAPVSVTAQIAELAELLEGEVGPD